MKLLVTLLSSNKLDFLKESYKSVKNQLPVKFKYDIVIIINTLNDEYYKIVKTEPLFKKIKMIRTESNGFPGKGHNSARIFYKKQKKYYDYLFTIDGDDFLYPWAFQRLEHYLKYKPDVLCLMFHDILSSCIVKNAHQCDLNNNKYLLYHNNEDSKKNWYKVKSINPFKNQIYTCNTPGRIILFSRNSLKYKIQYDDEVQLYDDFYPFMQILEYSVLNQLKIFLICDSDIYLYNKLLCNNENISASDNFFKDNSKFIDEEKKFKKSLKNKFLSIKDFNLTKIPVLELDKQDNYNQKILISNNILKNIKENHFKIINKKLLITTTYKNDLTLLKLFYTFYKTIWSPCNFLFIVGNLDNNQNKIIDNFNNKLNKFLVSYKNIIFPEYLPVTNCNIYRDGNIYVFIYDTQLQYETDIFQIEIQKFLLNNIHNGLKNIGHPIFEHEYYINVQNDDFIYTKDIDATLNTNNNTYHICSNIDLNYENFIINNSNKILSYKDPLFICNVQDNNNIFDINNIQHCCFKLNNIEEIKISTSIIKIDLFNKLKNNSE